VTNWRKEFKRLEGAYAPSTMKSYYVNVKIFVDWCGANELEAFPANVQTLAQFLEDQAHSRSMSTIRQRVYAIKKIHILLALPDPTNNEDINLVIRRIRRQKFARPKQAKALNRNHRNSFMSALPQTPWGLRDKVMIALGYDILARRSELVALKTADIAFKEDGSARVVIRRSKSDQFGNGRFTFTSRETANLLRNWLKWRGENIEYLFCPIYRGKVINRSLSCTTVKRVIKRAAELAGFDEIEVGEFSTHSMRVGAAQDLLCAGHDIASIMRAGGWKSIDVLARYLENSEHNVWIED
jgi:integrase/recombinase XerD